MRIILTILLLSTFSLHAQRAAVAMNMTATKMETGVLIAGSTLTVDQKATLAKDSLHCKTVRMSIILSSWSGSSSAFETLAAKGLKIIANINYYPSGSVQPFPTSAELPTLITNLTSFLDTYAGEVKTVCVENEELTASYHSGPLTDYVAECQAVYNVCHPRGILVMSGGVGGLNSGADVKIWRWLNSFDAAKTTDFASHMSNAELNWAQNPGTNSNIEKFVLQLDTLEGIKPYIDIFCFHTKEVQDTKIDADHSAVTSISGNMLMYKANYFRSRYNKFLADNETGADNAQPALVTNEMNEYLRLGFIEVQWWSGTGPNAVPFHDDATASLFDNGRVYTTFNDALNK